MTSKAIEKALGIVSDPRGSSIPGGCYEGSPLGHAHDLGG